MTTLENNHRLLAAAQIVLRLAIGFLFAAHGWQKFSQFTIAGTTASFTEMGVPGANLALGAGAAALALMGPGSWALDRLFVRRKGAQRDSVNA